MREELANLTSALPFPSHSPIPVTKPIVIAFSKCSQSSVLLEVKKPFFPALGHYTTGHSLEGKRLQGKHTFKGKIKMHKGICKNTITEQFQITSLVA